jgi:LacI family transcriptional regulator
MANIREVAERAGVSITTVSHVVNQTRFVAPETEQRVRQSMRELNYRPNSLARSLRRGETKTIGLILPDSANPFFAESARLLEEVAFQKSYSLILCNSNGDLEKERLYSEVLFNKQVDGIIFMAAGDDTQSLQELIDHQLPVVVVDRILDQMNVDAVITDNRASGYMAANHLIEYGHKRIGIIRGPSNLTPSAQRVIGYQQALEEAGLPIDPALQLTGDFHSESGYVAATQFLKISSPPTAIFACNDLMAIGALRAINEAGLSVPADLSIIGYDDIEMASYIQPAMTTIAQPIEELAETSINLLLERIERPGLSPRRIVLQNKLIIRQSTRRVS